MSESLPDRSIMDVVNEAAARLAEHRAYNQEKMARVLALASLPRGLKWFISHPKLMRAYYRVRPSKRPTMVVYK